MSASSTLLLFDIDGTLLTAASREHAVALRTALHTVHGVSAERLPPRTTPGSAAGRTDGEIARLLLIDADVPARQIDESATMVRDECCRLYASLCPPDLSDRVVPGMPDLLDWLSQRDDARLSLVTGNYEPVARLKLARAGLGHWFASGQGGFGSDSEDRTMLPAIARRRAGSDGVPWPRERTVVIGDTFRDIACARADGVRCVAVTTGPQQADQLTEADAVAQSTAELRSALSALLGS